METDTSITAYILMGIVLVPIGVYLVARLSTAAFFKSKQQYERQQHVPK